METRPLRPNNRDLGRVGEVVRVRSEVLQVLLGQGWLPVVSPISVDSADRRPTNVNADAAALAVTDSPDGVFDNDDWRALGAYTLYGAHDFLLPQVVAPVS